MVKELGEERIRNRNTAAPRFEFTWRPHVNSVCLSNATQSASANGDAFDVKSLSGVNGTKRSRGQNPEAVPYVTAVIHR